MTGISTSTAVRQINPALAALLLCALRLRMKLAREPELPLERGR